MFLYCREGGFFLLTSMLQDAALCFSFGGFSGGQGGYMNNRDKHVQFKANIMCARLSSRRSMPRNVFLKRNVGVFESVCVCVCVCVCMCVTHDIRSVTVCVQSPWQVQHANAFHV